MIALKGLIRKMMAGDRSGLRLNESMPVTVTIDRAADNETPSLTLPATLHRGEAYRHKGPCSGESPLPRFGEGPRSLAG